MRSRTIIGILLIFVVVAPMPMPPVAASSTWTDETVSVSGLGWYYYYGIWISGETAEVSIDVTSGFGISFYIMDQANYNIWSSGGTASLYIKKPNVMETSLTWTVPATKTYYFVLDNTNSIFSVNVHIRVVRYEEGEYLGGIFTIGILAVIGIVVVIGVVAALYHMKTKSKPSAVTPVRPPSQPAPPETPVQRVQAKYCANCGTRIPNGAGFCPSCGAPVARGE